MTAGPAGASFQGRPYGIALASVAVATGVCWGIGGFLDRTNLVMIYLVGTLAVALRGYRGASALSSVASVLAFDFFFVPPRFTFRVSDAQYLVTFAVMLATGLLISHLVIRLKEEADAVRQGEQRSLWLMEKAKKAEIDAEAERLRSSLLSAVSHDLRTPLTAIVGSAETLLARAEIQGNPAARDLVDNIQTEGERLTHLVQNLLETTRLESGAVRLHKERYPLEDVVAGALERLKKSLHGRVVDVALPEDLPSVPMDGLLIEQVFVNLLENAGRHTSSDAAIRISAAADAAGLTVSIEDRGPGIAPDARERVFEKFYRSPVSSGAGLGLAICRAIVQAHGGRIWVDDRAGGGAAFRFFLPVEDAHDA